MNEKKYTKITMSLSNDLLDELIDYANDRNVSCAKALNDLLRKVLDDYKKKKEVNNVIRSIISDYN